MDITISDEIASQPHIRDIVTNANEILKATIGRAPHPPTATWKLDATGDQEKPVALDLNYFDQSLSTPFSENELQDLNRLRHRLFRIWGRLIVKNFKATTQGMIETLGELREGLREEQQA